MNFAPTPSSQGERVEEDVAVELAGLPYERQVNRGRGLERGFMSAPVSAPDGLVRRFERQ
jgi:hypothetical protein